MTLNSKSVRLIIFLSGLALGIVVSECVGQTKAVSIGDKNSIYETPMAYELMHVAFALADTNIYSGKINVYYNDVDTSKPYYKEVMAYFSAFKDHKLIKHLNKDLRKSWDRYRLNLEKGYNSIVIGNTVSKDVQYVSLYNFISASRSEIESFANLSDFQVFYDKHRLYYWRFRSK